MTEKWSVFTALPEVFRHDNNMLHALQMINKGLIMPHVDNDSFHPKSLWPYFNILPDYCRNHPVVRRLFMGLEYRQPRILLEDKQRALNYAASLFMPIGEDMQDVLLEAMDRKKL